MDEEKQAAPDTQVEESSQQDDIESLLRFDPFAPADDTNSQGGGDDVQKDADAAAGDDKETDSTEGEGPAEGTDGEPAKNEAPTQQEQQQAPAQNAMTPEAVAAAVRAAMDSPQQRQQQSSEPQARFDFQQLPQELSDALRSEDPQEHSGAVLALTNGLANTIYQTVMQDVQQQFTKSVPNMVQERIQQAEQQRKIYSDFYEKYPNLASPELRPLVLSVAQEVLRKKGSNAQWNEAVRDEIGQAATSLLSKFAPQPPAAAQPAVTPKQTYQAGRTTRATAPTQSQSFEQDIAATLGIG